MHPVVRLCLCLTIGSLLTLTGCKSEISSSRDATAKSLPAEETAATTPRGIISDGLLTPLSAPASIEFQAQELLSMALPPEDLEAGWVRMFDGHSLAGWFAVGQANWQVHNGALAVDEGSNSFLCSVITLADYELKIDFRSNSDTNSGVFLRSSPQPEEPGIDCLELNIAPPSNPFPTGSFVAQHKCEPEVLGDLDSAQWHTYLIHLEGPNVTVKLDGKEVASLDSLKLTNQGNICLQFREGRVEFKNILVRPLQPKAIKVTEQWQDDWTTAEQSTGTLKVDGTSTGLHVKGGLGKVQSKQAFGDFWLQARYKLAQPTVNSGIFFRCLPDAMLDGYECQVNHATEDSDALRPADSGAGAIFRRQPARIVVGDGITPTYLSLYANGPQFVTWVNGIQVAEFHDTREADPNPRKGLRLEAGPIAIQGHDPTTDVTFEAIQITELNP